MPEERAQYRTAADRGLPESAQPEPERKRLSPRLHRPIRHDYEKQAQKYGRPKTMRFPDDFLEMLGNVENKYGVKAPELIMLAVSQYVAALERGKTELPVKAQQDESRVELELPEIPEIT